MADEERSEIFGLSVVAESQLADTSEHPPSVAIVEAIATAEGVTPTDLAPLYETVDADAIDRLFADRNAGEDPSLVLQFDLGPWTVVVSDDGTVRVCDPDHSAGTQSASETCTSD